MTVKAKETEEVKAEEQTKQESNRMSERVEFLVPISEGERSDLVIVVNGRVFQMRRGETVQVPRYVVEAYKLSERQKAESLRLQAESADRNLTQG